MPNQPDERASRDGIPSDDEGDDDDDDDDGDNDDNDNDHIDFSTTITRYVYLDKSFYVRSIDTLLVPFSFPFETSNASIATFEPESAMDKNFERFSIGFERKVESGRDKNRLTRDPLCSRREWTVVFLFV